MLIVPQRGKVGHRRPGILVLFALTIATRTAQTIPVCPESDAGDDGGYCAQ